MFQGKSVSHGATNKNLNAKKLDINFDSDDFFNSFEPMSTAPKPKKVEALPEESQKPANQFDVGSWSFEAKKETAPNHTIEEKPSKPKVTSTS